MRWTRLLLAAALSVPVAAPAPGATEPARPAPDGHKPGGHPELPPFPGGGRILFSRPLTHADPHPLGVVEADGTLSLLPAPQGHAYWDPADPDGVILASFGRRPDIRSYRLADDGWISEETWRVRDSFRLAVSTDGRYLVASRLGRHGDGEDSVRLLDRVTGEVRDLSLPGIRELRMGPDDRMLTTDPASGDHLLVDPRAAERTTVLVRRTDVEALVDSARFWTTEPTWSPDGRRFAMPVAWKAVSGDRHGLMVGRRDSLPGLITTPGRPSIPTWSPDGRRVAYIARGDGRGPRGRLFVHHLPTDRRIRIASKVSPADWASWSPDGRWLLIDDWARNRWLFVADDGSDSMVYPSSGHFPRWCCPASPGAEVLGPVC